ncbi:MAG: hypothetical protein EOP47_26140 [Sphingobacteriaceae bacterium]|nr:MAG: hypothetical protein EOP47_26140 [Sphingobacteriaceae bacterium]
MSLSSNNGQKSLKRRFLLILGVTTFICVTTIGIMIMFWDRMNLPLEQWQRYVFGAFFITYGIVRFSRLLKKDPND